MSEQSAASTPESPRVAVRGEARLEFDPEIARLVVVVSARGSAQRPVLDDLTRRNAEVLELLRSQGEACERLETGAFSVTPELTDKGKREKVRSYRGQARVTATLGDFTVLGELATQLADQELTRVEGPFWALRPDSPARARTRQQAVREAVTRAREYAEALDARLVALLDLADEGAEPGPAPAPRAPAGRSAAGYGGPAAPAPLDLEPQRQVLHARVNARFVITPPSF
ncbi:SIMPL domain-containing protein [Streptomyces sp. NPDC005438]|uniref:SIMPL domain-containing protein n=1 Tax=Streptomyces sp. NPDC005438 TaxID=3156880 RepID=UPI0033AE45FF